MKMGLSVKKLDWIIIAVVLAIAAAAWAGTGWFKGYGRADALRVEIYIDGELMETIPLTETERKIPIQTAYGSNVLSLGPGGAKITDADCAARICVHAPFIAAPGEMIACLPHKLLIRITGETVGEVDAVAG